VIPDEQAAPLEGSVPGQSVFEPVQVAAEPKADQLSAVGVDLDRRGNTRIGRRLPARKTDPPPRVVNPIDELWPTRNAGVAIQELPRSVK
jgi:hypothetical protein